MVILDVTVVNVALPSIGKALSFGAADLQWVVTVYVLFTGGLMLLGGRATDLLGRRPVFLVGLLVFTAASLASGLAWSPLALIVSRATQGFGAALLLPSALAIITTTYSHGQRTVALSIWGAIGSAGVAVGVLFGGVITTALGWEWIFFINVPIGIVVAAGAIRLLPAAQPVQLARMKLDLLGAATAAGRPGDARLRSRGNCAARLGVRTHAAPARRCCALLVAFIGIERRGREPLVPPATWRVRLPGLERGRDARGDRDPGRPFYLNTLYLQNVLGYSALKTGLSFLPLALVIFAAAHLASRLLPHAGSRIVALGGLALVAGGALLLAAAPDHASYATDLLPGFLLVGAGVGLVFVAVTVTAMADVRDEQAGLASGIMTTAHELGAALGVAVLAAVAIANGNPVSGYGNGFLVAAAIAALLAVVAAVALPAFRPAPGTHASMH